MGIGEWAALGAALMWTLSSLLWGRVNLSAIGINLWKNFFAVAFLLIHLAFVYFITGQPAFNASTTSWGWLSLSGIIGIVIGDTFYFRSLQILGPRRALMMATTSPLFTALIGWLILNENLTGLALVGILLTVVGISLVIRDRKAGDEAPGLFPGKMSTGVLFGILSAICQALGGVVAKMGLKDCAPLESAFIRILIAGIAMFAIVAWQRKLGELTRKAMSWNVLKYLIPGAAIGTWLGIWLSQVGYKEASSVAIANTLIATSPIFAIPIVWMFDGHRATLIAIAGTLIAVLGIGIAVMYSAI